MAFDTKLKASIFWGAMAYAWHPLVALAQTNLETVVVTGSRAETRLTETPVSIGAVGRAQWEADKAKTVGEIINRIPGVFWNDLGNEQHSMAIRQPISTNPVYQYLEDGIPIRPLGVFNHNALNEINMNGAQGVEVVKGAASALYGSNAVGGAVNFLTQKPSLTPTGYLGVRHDNTDGFSRIDTGASNTWGDLGLRFSHYSSRREDNNWQQYSGGSKDSFTLRGAYKLSQSSSLRASIVHTNLDSDTQGNLTEDEFLNKPGVNINTFTYRKDKATRVNVAWEGNTTDNGLTTVTVFTRENDHGQLPSYTISNCSGGTCRGTENNNAIQSLGVDVKHEEFLNWFDARLVTGVYIDNSRNDYWSNNLLITQVNGVNMRYVVHPSRRTGERKYQTDIANRAVFAQLNFSPAPDWHVVAGGRYDSVEYDFKNHLTPGADFGSPNEVRRFSKFSPQVGATWAITPQASLYANWSKGFTPPEVSQLYGKSAIPDLKPSDYDNKEMGARIAFSNGVMLDTSIYQLGGRDTIVSFTPTGGDSENRNAGQTRSRGLELALNQKIGAVEWQLGASYSQHKYLTYQVSNAVDYSGKTISAAPKLILNGQLAWHFLPASRIAFNVVHLGAYWMDDANTRKYPGHTLLNVTTSHKLGHGWELWGQIRNLTDKLYADSASRTASLADRYRAGSPRSVMIGVSKSFGDH